MKNKDKCRFCAIRQECELRQRIKRGLALKCINWITKPWEGNKSNEKS